MAKKLIIDPGYLAKNPTSFTLIRQPGQKSKKISVGGETMVTLPAGAGGPEQKVRVPGPTQADLEILFKQGCSYVIEVEDQAK